MDAVFSFFKGIVDLGAAVMLPIVLIIIGLFFRMKLGQAIKSGLMVGIGFQGLCLVVNLLTTSIQPVIKYYQTMGSGFYNNRLRIRSSRSLHHWSRTWFALPIVLAVDRYRELDFTEIKMDKSYECGYLELYPFYHSRSNGICINR